ncbi:hypothetical protein ACFU1R_20540 [Priestia megaterium]|uniref:hypothetical protein n=1 Tax=Priestia megaterium TaxID=1404 RepID=UPI003670B810
MARDLELDLTGLMRALQGFEDEAQRSLHGTMDEIKDDWVQKSRDVAPLDDGNLRRQIDGTVEGNGANSKVIVTGNATNSSRGYGRFNYGYSLHEEAPSSTNLSTQGTTLKFLDEPAQEREAKWMQWLENDLRDAARRRGF